MARICLHGFVSGRVQGVSYRQATASQAERLDLDGWVRNVPDGLAFAPDGSLFISCYEPSRIYRWRKDRGLETLIEDPAATTIAHPTNIAFKGDKLYTANLGRWHITEIDLSSLGSF